MGRSFDRPITLSSFLSPSCMNSTVTLIASSLVTFVQIYSLLVLVRVLLSWFPNIDWYSQPFAIVSQLTDPYLNFFRGFIPPLGGLDLSPMLALILLQVLRTTLISAAVASSVPF